MEDVQQIVNFDYLRIVNLDGWKKFSLCIFAFFGYYFCNFKK